jgi:transglutaminase/protease-like cytokinesis protein 3
MKYLFLTLATFMSINLFSQYSFNKVDSIVFSNKYKSTNVKDLSKEISKDFESDSNKIRAFYIYIVNNIMYDISLSNRVWYPKSQEEMDSITLYEVNQCIKTKKGICWDFSALFQKLCFYQGIEAEQIGGTLRDTENLPENRIENHGWNSLILNGKRKFIDCTFEPPKNYDRAAYDKFFLVDPEEFIYRYLPSDPQKQYLKTAISYEQFKSLAYVGNAFFENKIKHLSPNLFNVKIKSDSHYLITFQITNIDKLTAIEIYINEKLVQNIDEINSKINLNLNHKLVPGDKIKIKSINTISKDKFGALLSTAPLITYVVI